MSDEEIPRCVAKSTGSGERCRKRPIVGGTVCFTHGGATPQVRQKAAQRIVEGRVMDEVRRLGWGPVTDPVEAYADNAGEVLAFKDRLRGMVDDLDEQWTMRIASFGGDEDGGGLMAMGEQVRAVVAAYERALDRSERTLARMISLGLDAKAIELRAESIHRSASDRMRDLLVTVLAELGHDMSPGSEAEQVVLRNVRPLMTPVAELGSGAAS